jgi:hypothetical protein
MPNFSTRYRSSGDASMRHSGTYIAIFNPDTGLKTPYYVGDVGGERSNPTLSLSSPRGDRRVNIGDANVIMERPTLGMVNYRCGVTRKLFAVWHESRASRQIKRSLDFNLIDSSIIGALALSRIMHVSLDTTNSRQRAVDTFYNKEYPSFSECREQVASGSTYSLAFSDKFALCAHKTAGIVVYYKDKIVGYMGDTHPILLTQFEYLTEQLEEAANGYV